MLFEALCKDEILINAVIVDAVVEAPVVSIVLGNTDERLSENKALGIALDADGHIIDEEIVDAGLTTFCS